MLNKSIPRTLYRRLSKNISNYKWEIFLNTSNPSANQLNFYSELESAGICNMMNSLKFSPFKIYHQFYNLTLETTVYFSDYINMGWIAGILLGSSLIR